MTRLLSGGFWKPRRTSSDLDSAGDISTQSTAKKATESSNVQKRSLVKCHGRRAPESNLIFQPLRQFRLSDFVPQVSLALKLPPQREFHNSRIRRTNNLTERATAECGIHSV